MGEAGEGSGHPVGNRPLRPPPPPGQGHQQHQQGIAFALDGKTNGIRAAEGQNHRQRPHPLALRSVSQGQRLRDHHGTAGQIGQPGQQPQADRGLPHHLPPAPEQGVIERGMGVLPQHLHHRLRTGLKAFADAVQLIAPQRRGIDQNQCLERERDRNHHGGHRDPMQTVHRH